MMRVDLRREKMRMTPNDISQKTFNRKIMGYDPEEVTDFLRKIAGELGQCMHEKNKLQGAIREKELNIIEYKERDELLKKTIATATKMAERMHTDSNREAKLILDQAFQKAQSITKEAKQSLKDIHNEINHLKKVRLQFENNLRTLIQSHLSMLEKGKSMAPTPLSCDVTQAVKVLNTQL